MKGEWLEITHGGSFRIWRICDTHLVNRICLMSPYELHLAMIIGENIQFPDIWHVVEGSGLDTYMMSQTSSTSYYFGKDICTKYKVSDTLAWLYDMSQMSSILRKGPKITVEATGCLRKRFFYHVVNLNCFWKSPIEVRIHHRCHIAGMINEYLEWLWKGLMKVINGFEIHHICHIARMNTLSDFGKD